MTRTVAVGGMCVDLQHAALLRVYVCGGGTEVCVRVTQAKRSSQGIGILTLHDLPGFILISCFQ